MAIKIWRESYVIFRHEKPVQKYRGIICHEPSEIYWDNIIVQDAAHVKNYNNSSILSVNKSEITYFESYIN